MSERFYLESPLGEAQLAQLVDAEAHHLIKVMRASVGDEITLFDGSGHEFLGRITQLRKSQVDVQIESRLAIDRELPSVLTLAVSLPKGDRQKVLVEKCVELGVTALVPLETERGVAEATDSALARLKRQVIEASKQCRRNRLMRIDAPRSLSVLFSEVQTNHLRLLADPSSGALPHWERNKATTVAIGPEGGFTSDELAQAAAAGWQIIGLGPRILRVETAALAIAAAISLANA